MRHRYSRRLTAGLALTLGVAGLVVLDAGPAVASGSPPSSICDAAPGPVTGPGSTGVVYDPANSNPTQCTMAQQLEADINTERAARSLGALAWNGILQEEANYWADQLVSQKGFPQGDDPNFYTNVAADGWSGPAGMNTVGIMPTNAGQANSAFMYSTPHRNNMLWPAATAVAVAFACNWSGCPAVEVFGGTTSSTEPNTSPTPNPVAASSTPTFLDDLPDPVTNLSATTPTYEKVTLDWTTAQVPAGSDPLTGYRLYLCAPPEGSPACSQGGTYEETLPASATSVTVSAPPGPQSFCLMSENDLYGPQWQSLQNAYACGRSSATVTVSVPPPPLSGLSPSSGTTRGGTDVTIYGSDLPGAGQITEVYFGTRPAKIPHSCSPDSCVVVAPPAPAGKVPVSVSGPDGTSSGVYYTYVAPPPPPPPAHKPPAKVVGIAFDSRTGGRYTVSNEGNVFNYHAPFFGSAARKRLPAPIVGLAFDSRTGGYYLVTAKGNVFTYRSPFFGSAARKPLSAKVVGIAFDPRTGGYWLVTAKGNVFNYHAPFFGSAARKRLPAPIVGIAFNSRTGGYYLVTARGNVFTYHAPFFGSAARKPLSAKVVGIAFDARTGGYWLVTAKGNVYNYRAPGFPARQAPLAPVVGIAFNSRTGGYWVATSSRNLLLAAA